MSPAPLAIVMITLNEGHNMRSVLDNVTPWAEEVWIVDSYSRDDTVSIALEYGANVVQRRFRGFGDQWNFALRELPVKAEWTMKLDPDERLADELKQSIEANISDDTCDGMWLVRRLWFMGRPLGVKQKILRVWRTGRAHFTDVAVNEHPIVEGNTIEVSGEMEHRDSPDLDHWLAKQNSYSTAEAIIAHQKGDLAAEPKLLGTPLERRMWIKRNFYHFPFRYLALFLYSYFITGAFRAGKAGYMWARLRVDIKRHTEYKIKEITMTGQLPEKRLGGSGEIDGRVRQFD